MSSMCAHVRVSLRAHCPRACASFVLLPMFPDLEFYTMGFDCLARFGTINWSILVKLHGEGLCTLAARVFFTRMCAGMAARPVCARMCACRCAHTVGAHMLVGTVSKCCALVFCAHVRRNGSASSMCAHVRVSLRAHCRRAYAIWQGQFPNAARLFFARMCAGRWQGVQYVRACVPARTLSARIC